MGTVTFSGRASGLTQDCEEDTVVLLIAGSEMVVPLIINFVGNQTSPVSSEFGLNGWSHHNGSVSNHARGEEPSSPLFKFSSSFLTWCRLPELLRKGKSRRLAVQAGIVFVYNPILLLERVWHFQH